MLRLQAMFGVRTRPPSIPRVFLDRDCGVEVNVVIAADSDAGIME